MNTKPHALLVILLGLLLVPAVPQDKSKDCPKPVTERQRLTGTIPRKAQEPIEIVGQAAYTITALNSDDSLVGILEIALADEEREKVAQALGKRLSEIPAAIRQPDVVAQLYNGTECPKLRFVYPAMELELAGSKIQFKRFVLILDLENQYLRQIKRKWRRDTPDECGLND